MNGSAIAPLLLNLAGEGPAFGLANAGRGFVGRIGIAVALALLANLAPRFHPAVAGEPAPATASPRTYTVYRIAAPGTAPRVDGRLDDACWRAVPWQTGFVAFGPAAGAAKIQTQFAMAWDEKCLYVAIRALEPQMNRLVARGPEFNENEGQFDDGDGPAPNPNRGDITTTNPLFSDDHIEVFLSAEKDRQDWRRLAVNSAGQRMALAFRAKKIVGALFQEDANGGPQMRMNMGFALRGPRPFPVVVAPAGPGGAAAGAAAPAKWVVACHRSATAWEAEMAIPLAAVKIEPREGATFAGNVGRTRAVGQSQTQQTAWTALADGFGEPDRFGTLTLAGNAPPEAAAMSLAIVRADDVVTTLMGDRFVGAISGISEDGWLKLKGPGKFQDEVSISEAALDRIEMSPTSAPATGLRIMLVNGDTFLAQLKTIGPEETSLVSSAIGALTIPTTAISAITLGSSEQTVVDTMFDLGEMDPWTPVQGAWAIQDGRLVFSGAAGGEGVLAALVPQKGAVTFVADMEPTGGQGINCEMVLVADQNQSIRQNGRNGLSFMLWADGGRLDIYCSNNGNGNGLGASQFPRMFRGGMRNTRVSTKLRVSYDPADGSIQTWLDDQKGSDLKAVGAPKEGTHILFISRAPLALRRLRVLRGVVPPTEEAAEPAGEGPRATLLNGDVVSAKGITFADGKFLIKTEFGDMQPDMGHVAAVYLNRRSAAAKSVTPPRPALPPTTQPSVTIAPTPAPPRPAPAPDAPKPGDIRVVTTDGQFTLRSCTLSDDLLTGRSPVFGTISLKRDSLRLIRFFQSLQ